MKNLEYGFYMTSSPMRDGEEIRSFMEETVSKRQQQPLKRNEVYMPIKTRESRNNMPYDKRTLCRKLKEAKANWIKETVEMLARMWCEEFGVNLFKIVSNGIYCTTQKYVCGYTYISIDDMIKSLERRI